MVAEYNTDLSTVHEQLRQYILQIEDRAALEERNRIAREIHDSLGNALTTLNIQLQTALKLWHLDPAQARQFLAEAQQLGNIAIKEVRQSVSNMRENQPLEQSPEALINSLVENFYSATGVLPSTKISLSAPLPNTVVMTIYRIVQEALTNISKYAQATEVQIHLTTTPMNLSLIILDNGKGFTLSQKKSGFGIQGMRERVAALKGDLNIETKPGCGCKITVELSLAKLSVGEQKEPEKELSLAILKKARAKKTKPCLVLSPEQYSYLENILIELVGAVAPTLIRQVAASASSYKELIDNLVQHVPVPQQLELKKRATPLLEESTIKPKSRSDNLQYQQSQAITESFIRQCEEDLAELIGPMASLLVKEAVRSSRQMSRAKLVSMLAAQIPESQTALKFQLRLLSVRIQESGVRSQNS
ncbi:MAG: sensor histidine kinase [Stigonema ocellatum SAG 48.90 = DSM 106950]|nr:sensor histidine kinase [Stigonema ocellatum SAG 48.90 = DSM 106950]